MIPKTFEDAYSQVKGLAERFAANETAYLSPKYQEAEVRQDFLDKFWVALGWDVYHQEHPNPYEREVKIEKSVMVGDRGKRADYAFYTRPNFLQARFMAEAKKPARQLENQYDCFQAMRYGWNSNTPLAVLTDFEQFLILDSRYKPTVEKAANGIIEKFHYSQFTDEEAFRKIYYLFSREAVGDGSLEKFIQTLKKAKTAKAAKVAPAVQIQQVGDTFLTELDVHRDALARGFKRNNEELDGDELTEITQRTLDRLVFIRFLEDKLVEPSEVIDRLGVKTGSKWRDLANEIPRLNSVYNGIIFKPHAILDSPTFQPDEKAFSDTLEWLSHKNSPYDFNTIPIHILGSIYERFLGKTIVVTDKRAKLEEKPEVRKAGGVYYTPEYIVRYIVENTIGKLLGAQAHTSVRAEHATGAETDAGADADGIELGDNKLESTALTNVRAYAMKPDEIAKMRFADIACGSGSFLLGIFDYLIKYHVEWYSANKTRREDAIKKGLCRETSDGTLQLTIPHKRDILLNNIYGVDLDAQAVEVAQLSLYLKLLEEETTATAQQYLAGFREQLLPPLNNNIVHGNSLIDYDIMDGQLFDSKDLKKLNPMSFQSTFPEVFANGGFDAIVGNPPYIRIQTMQETSPLSVEYFKKKYLSAGKGNYDIYVVFVEKALSLLNENGKLGYILPHKFFNAKYGEALRGIIAKGKNLAHVVHFGDQQVFAGATTYTCLLLLNRRVSQEFEFKKVDDLTAWRDNSESKSGILSSEMSQTDEWNFNVGESSILFARLQQIPHRLGSITDRIAQGIRTSANEIYVLEVEEEYYDDDPNLVLAYSKYLDRSVVLEKEWLSNFLQGREIRPFEIISSGKVLIVPYALDKGRAELISATEFKATAPKTFKYLSETRDFLENRENGRMMHSGWFGYVYPKNLEVMKSPKLLIPDIANRASFAFDEFGDYAFTSGYAITLKEEVNESIRFVLGLVNSKLLDFYWKQISTNLRGGYFRYFTQFIEQLPIRTIDFNNPAEKAMHDRMVELVEKMIDGKKKLAEARTDSDRALFERLTQSLDTQIDGLVYQLYDITPDERKIIEGN